MPEQKKTGLSLEPYKGVRDFYPEDMAVQNYIFDVMRKTVESFGYTEYSASILEPAELYRAKSSEEIVNEQTYTFTDRGGREVTLRPEMTPTVARMVAAKKRELSFPLRWYSIPNLFRYERPQRGRLREHWQLNVDMFGAEKRIEADAEIISVAYRIMKSFGIKDEDFQIQLNHREILTKFFFDNEIAEEQWATLRSVLDKRRKLSEEGFERKLASIIGSKLVHGFIYNFDSFDLFQFQASWPVQKLREILSERGVKNVSINRELVRGFDYYTGMVFEIFETSSKNNRSLFGGGRYDDLLTIFGQEKVPAVGFGMGDVTIRDVLETYNLIPDWVTKRSKTDLAVCTMNADYFSEASALASRLRERGINVAVDYRAKKISDQIKKADRERIPFIVCIGEEEIASKTYKVKELATGKETAVSEEDIPAIVQMNNE